MKSNCLLIAFIYFFISCNDSTQTNNQTNKPTTNLVDTTTATQPTTSNQQLIKQDTIYNDFFYEDTLRNGYRFGMTLSEWNKRLAILANDGVIKELSEIDFATSSNFVRGSYKGFIPIDKSDDINRKRIGFYLTGLFSTPSYHSDTVEIFRLNGKPINEPILIGIQLDCDVPYRDFAEVINIMVGKDNLEYVAGPDPMLPDNSPLTVEDFSDPVAESLGKFAKESGGSSSDEKYVSKTRSTKTLFQGRFFYSSIEVVETDNASVQRNSDYKIISMDNAYRNYTLTQKLFSKKQFNLNVEDYMTGTQLDNYKNSSTTKELIDKALH